MVVRIHDGRGDAKELGERGIVEFSARPNRAEIENVENTCVEVTGERVKLPSRIAHALKERGLETIRPDEHCLNQLKANLLALAGQIEISPGLFSELREESFAVQTNCVRNAPVLARKLKKADNIVVVMPYEYRLKGRDHISKRFRIIVDESDEFEYRTRPALHMLLNEWKDFAHSYAGINHAYGLRSFEESGEDLLQLLERIAKQGEKESGWDLLAIAFARYTRIDPSMVERVLVKRNVARNFFHEVFDGKFDSTTKGIYKVIQKFYERHPNHSLLMMIKYQVPVVYGMDLGSVFKRKIEEKEGNGKGYSTADLLAEFGNLMYLRPLDIFCTEIRRTEDLKESLFASMNVSQIFNQISGFIKEHVPSTEVKLWQPRVPKENLQESVA